MSKFDDLDLTPSKPSVGNESKICKGGELYSSITGEKEPAKKNVVFFTGAGFSKAWDEKYPVGLQLFSIDDFNSLKLEYNFFQVADDLKIGQPKKDESYKLNTYETAKEKADAKWKSDSDYIKKCYDYFQEIKFSFDIFKRYPSLMPICLNTSLIIALENEMKSFIKKRFVHFVGEEEFTIGTEHGPNKQSFIKFFESIHGKTANLSFISTNYDLVIEKIISGFSHKVTLNRGVIDNPQFKEVNWHRKKIDLYKINGGFEIFQGINEQFYINHADINEENIAHIILPSKEQNYDDKYFKSVFIKSASALRSADVLVFVGYSLPVEDHTIQFLLKNFSDSSNKNKEVVILSRDFTDAQLIKEKAQVLFPDLSEKDAIHAFDGSFVDLIDSIP